MQRRGTGIGQRFHAFAALLGLGLSMMVGGMPPPVIAAVTPEDFGYRSMVPRTNIQPLLVVLVRFDDTNSGPSVAETANWIFPDTPTNLTVNGFYAEMAAGRFAFTNAGIVPIVESATNRYDAMKERLGTNFNDGVYLSNLYVRAVQTNPVAFATWDVNGDQKLSQAELFILFVLKDGLGGASRGMPDFLLPGYVGWAWGNVIASPPGAIKTISHELAHMLGTTDLYGIWGGAEQDMNQGLSLMAGPAHLDAWHKMRLGWYEPRIYSLRTDGTATLSAAQRRIPSAPIVLYDETRGADEYFLLEYRTRECAAVPNTYYIHDEVADSGLLIWHVWQATNHSLLQHAEVVYPTAERHWWQCKYCRVLYRPGEVRRPCASTNSTHVNFGDKDVHYLIKDVPSDPGEHGWRRCVKCDALCYQPLNAESACPAGGQHAPQSSGDYSLAKNVPGPVGHNNWTRCTKCQALFLFPERDTSVCAEDGGLHQADTARYTLIAGWAHRTLMSRSAPDLMLGENQLWHSGTTTPHLTWYDGTSMALRIGVDPFTDGADYIRVRWMTWDPLPLVVSHPTSLLEGFNTFTVSVTDGTNAVAAATVNIKDSQGGEWEKTTAANGTATFSLSLLGPKTLHVSVTKERCLTYTGTISVGTGYLTFDPVNSPQQHGVPFPITVRVRSAAGVVSNFTGSAALEAFRQSKAAALLLTECLLGRAGAYFRGLQVQNVSAETIATAGWRVAIGDNPTNINAVNATVKSLPASMNAGAFLAWTHQGVGDPWGSPIAWAQDQPGWAMILNADYEVVDFAAWGWDSQAIQTMAPVINSHVVSVASAWAGDGISIPTGNKDLCRHGYEDRDVADDFWASSLNILVANPNLTLPFGSAEVPVSLEPEITGAFTNGVWSGSVALLEVVDDVTLRAVAGPRQGESTSFDVEPTVLHHYAFAPISSPKIWNAPFPVTITAQDASSNTVLSFNGPTRLYGFQSVPTPPVLITECNLGEPDIVEVQNVTTRSVNTTGWRLLVGDDARDIDDFNKAVRPLPTSLAARQVYWAKDDPASTNYWGGSLNWSNGAPGWVMLLDAQTNIVDFVAWGWSEEDIAALSPTYGRVRLPVASHWAGSGVAFLKKGLSGSLQRRGSIDYNRAYDFTWSTFTSHGYQNSALTVPLTGAFAPIAISPETTGNFTNGIWSGHVTILEDATNVFLQALDGTGRRGESTQFEARYLGQLTVVLPATAREGDGVLTGEGTIQFPGLAKGGTRVYLTSSDTTELTVPASVTIIGAQSSVTFNLTVVDDTLFDLGRSVTIQATASGYSNGVASMVVLDNEAITGVLNISGSFAEGNGVRTNAAEITLSRRVDEPVVFAVVSSDTSEIQVPASVTVPAGADAIRFNLTVVDDTLADGAQSVTVSATSPGATHPLTDTVSVADNDPHHFDFSALSGARMVMVPFTVTIRAADAGDTTVTAFKGHVNLAALSAAGPLLVQPPLVGPFTNGLWSGLVTVRQPGTGVQLVVSDAGATGTSTVFVVTSGPFHHFAWDPLPAAAHAGAWLPVRLTACDSNNFPITSFAGPVQLSASRQAAGHPVRLLTFTRYAEAADYSNTLAAISSHFTDFSETATTALDATELAEALGTNDVFLIVAQDETDPITLGTLGSTWAKTLETFVANGGVLIVCAGRNDEHRLLGSANLLDLERFSYGWESAPLVRWMESPLTAGVAPLFTGRSVGAFYESAAYMHIATVNEGVAVAVTHAYAAGTVVAFASDFSVLGTDLDRVLANAVRLGTPRVAEPVAMSPAVATSFTDGVWTGVVSALDAGLDLQFSATDGAGQTNHSSRLDAGPLFLAPVERTLAGELILHWNSDGVTRYTIEGSTSLEPGSFVPILTDVTATPPANTCLVPTEPIEHAFYRIRVQSH